MAKKELKSPECIFMKILNEFNSIQFYSCSIISTTGKVTSQLKSCTSHCAVVIKYKEISMKLDIHYIYTLEEDIYK
jgi:hypothetical protein